MRRTFAVTAAAVLSLGVLGGGMAVASNGDADQLRERDRTQSCSQDCDGAQKGEPGGVQARERSHARAGTRQENAKHNRYGVRSGEGAEGRHGFGAAGMRGGSECRDKAS
jgi:hypothetical protein